MSKRKRGETTAAPGRGIVALNVGGTLFTTTKDTLAAVPDSLLGRMFDDDSNFGSIPSDENGAVFFDRDPEIFRWILDFLRRRGRSVGMPRSELVPFLRDEADYFGLVNLVAACDAAITATAKAEAAARVKDRALNEAIKDSATTITRHLQESIAAAANLSAVHLDKLSTTSDDIYGVLNANGGVIAENLTKRYRLCYKRYQQCSRRNQRFPGE